MIAVSEWQVKLYITTEVCLTIKIKFVIGKGGGRVMEINLFCLFLGNNLNDCVKTFFQVE